MAAFCSGIHQILRQIMAHGFGTELRNMLLLKFI
jgi:hypothetical protein